RRPPPPRGAAPSPAAAEAEGGAKEADAVDRTVDVAGSAVRDLHLVGAEALLRVGIHLGADRAARRRVGRRSDDQDGSEDRDTQRSQPRTAIAFLRTRRSGAQSSPGASG